MFPRFPLCIPMTLAVLLTCAVVQGQPSSPEPRVRFPQIEDACAKYPQLCPNGPQAEWWATLQPRVLALDAVHAARQVAIPKPWQLECSLDAIRDTKTCTMQRGSLYVRLIRHKKLVRPRVSIINGHDAYPGHENILRVDTLPIHTVETDTFWSGPQAQSIINQLLQGHTARTRLIAWPYGNPIDDEIPLDGFSSSLAQLHHAIREP